MFQLQNLDTEVRPYLSRWYEESVMHIHRVVQMVQSNISFLLHAVSPSAEPNVAHRVIMFSITVRAAIILQYMYMLILLVPVKRLKRLLVNQKCKPKCSNFNLKFSFACVQCEVIYCTASSFTFFHILVEAKRV